MKSVLLRNGKEEPEALVKVVMLENLSLLDASGKMHESLRNIVLSATKGDGLDTELVSPLQG